MQLAQVCWEATNFQLIVKVVKIVNLSASQNSKLLLLHHFAAQFGHKEHSANVHRGAYALAERATEAQYATSRSLSRMRLFFGSE